MTVNASVIVERYRKIVERIAEAARAAKRDPAGVRLVAVSKTHPYAAVRALYDVGHRDFGENYVQELVEKAEAARADGLTDIRWHFIGHLQTNKVKVLVPHAAMIHGVDSAKLAEEIAKRAEAANLGKIPILLEVNVDGQESKSGVQISELRNLAASVSRIGGVDLQGLMCIPDPNRPAGAREAFRRVAVLGADLGMREFSMGMTADFFDAIAEGATLVRVGTAIFGERSPREKF
ncbi:MAG: YggS family pyridoxal phosphate-dependent enzyme [Bdellovibrionales bacterium]|nr:YggS family pyridoxal phosphate-dependent enzyme [Bdellovibrionales bacterium]